MPPLFEEKRAPRFQRLNNLLREFTPFQRMMLYGFTILLGLSSFVLLAKANNLISVEIPASGGSLIEGAVGTPRFINPLLAASQSDQDLTTLIYSGLLREEKDGTFTPDLASSYDISADGTVYTFHLRPDLTFHDGKPLTSEDVLFTVGLAQNADVKSTRRADWEGVSAQAPDPNTIIFTLPHSYAPFLENATMGVLPKHVWQSIPVQEFPFSPANTRPIGSGAYKIKDVKSDTTGAPTEYQLVPFSGFALGEANITHITYRIYPSDEALQGAFEDGKIDSFVSSSPKDLPRTAGDDANLVSVPLSRVFGIFLNQNHAPILANASVRAALDAAVDKQKIIDEVLGGYGAPLGGPIPPGLFTDAASTSASSTEAVDQAQAARDILTKGGWKFSTSNASSTTPTPGSWSKDGTTLSVTLATADTDELVATAHAVADAWNAAGIRAQVQVYPLQELNSTILRPRAYDAVLFGEVVGRTLDLYAFWHSSQRNDPGLNLALYANADADKALADARAETDPIKRLESYQDFLDAVGKDTPAVFLYAPDIVYLVPKRVQGIDIGTITTPSERFIDVYKWYRDTERVWDIFAPKSQDSSL
jgi:peptide/nickel transport system substrate-binding protein